MRTVRTAAAAVLLAVEDGRTTLAAELERARAGIADERDRGLLVELTAGVLRWQAELDAILASRASRPRAALDRRVRVALRLGAYELRHLARIPARATVHETVELVRALGRPRAAGFVNAVLRSLARNPTTTSLPVRPERSTTRADRLAYLSTTLSHPEWLVARWLDRHGFEAAEAWCQFNNRAPDTTVRPLAEPVDALLAALREAGVEARPARFVRDAIQLPPGALGRLPATLRNRLAIQDEASQLVAHVVGARPGECIADLCASPGGKTLVLWSDLSARGLLVAADHRDSRVRLLRKTLLRAGAQVSVVRLDATRPLPFGAVFDRVLLDVPCSGLGTLRRDPDLKWNRGPAMLADFAATQAAMLDRGAEVVRPGGRLIYATCSSEPEENETAVAAFLARDGRFAAGGVEPGPFVKGADALVSAQGYLQTWPFRDELDAFFAAVLVRR